MPNLLTTLMPATITPTSVQVGGSGTASTGKYPLLTDGSAIDGNSFSFPDTLSEQLAGATAWLNLTADGKVPAALLLPLGGNGLPPDGAELQSLLGDAMAAEELDDTSSLLMGLPLLPPGMAPLGATTGARGEAELGLLARGPGNQLAVLGKGEQGTGFGALAKDAMSTAQAGLENSLAADTASGDADQELLQVIRETIAGERTALQRGSDPLTLRGLVNALQGGENLLQSTSPAAVNPAFAPLAASPTASVTTLPQFTIDIPPGQPGWSEALGERVAWMLNNQQPGAQLRINPPHLGPLDIKVSVHNDQANITFTAHHAVTADTLEAALPRLREMLADSGLQLAHFDVRHQGGGAEAQGDGNGGASGEGDLVEGIAEDESRLPTSVSVLDGSGLVDTFA